MKLQLLNKTMIAALVAALMLAAIPLTGVSAAGLFDDPLPLARGREVSDERLEKIWERMNQRYERLGKTFDKSDGLVEKAEKMIARLEEAGEPAAELEAALDAFQDAIKEAHPIYESCKGIINSHQGFDADGKVTDAAQAKETIKELGAKFGEIRKSLDGTGKALIELMKAIIAEYKSASLAPDA